MTFDEICAAYCLEKEKLLRYQELALLDCQKLTGGGREGREKEFRRLGRILSFLKAGVTPEVLNRNPVLLEDGEQNGERIRALKKERCRLLGDIHEIQQSLDCLDSMIRQIRDETRGVRKIPNGK